VRAGGRRGFGGGAIVATPLATMLLKANSSPPTVRDGPRRAHPAD
jgi:hypothetical protein